MSAKVKPPTSARSGKYLCPLQLDQRLPRRHVLLRRAQVGPLAARLVEQRREVGQRRRRGHRLAHHQERLLGHLAHQELERGLGDALVGDRARALALHLVGDVVEPRGVGGGDLIALIVEQLLRLLARLGDPVAHLVDRLLRVAGGLVAPIRAGHVEGGLVLLALQERRPRLDPVRRRRLAGADLPEGIERHLRRHVDLHRRAPLAAEQPLAGAGRDVGPVGVGVAAGQPRLGGGAGAGDGGLEIGEPDPVGLVALPLRCLKLRIGDQRPRIDGARDRLQLAQPQRLLARAARGQAVRVRAPRIARVQAGRARAPRVGPSARRAGRLQATCCRPTRFRRARRSRSRRPRPSSSRRAQTPRRSARPAPQLSSALAPSARSPSHRPRTPEKENRRPGHPAAPIHANPELRCYSLV